jgi:hypothetical protein
MDSSSTQLRGVLWTLGEGVDQICNNQ